MLGLRPVEAPKKQTISDAREKIEWTGFEFLVREARRDDLETPWNSHIVRIADGTKFRTPNSVELREYFKIPHSKAGPGYYPQGLMVTLINSTTAQPIAAAIGDYRESERDLMVKLLDRCGEGDIILLDRGLGGPRVYLECYTRGMYFIHRATTSGTTAALYVQDFLASNQASALYTVAAKDSDGEEIHLWIRLIKGPIDSEGKRIVFVTNLLDEEIYSTAAIRELYRERWTIETAYGRIKNLLCLEKFHAKNYNGVMQEIFANLLMMSLTAIIEIEASNRLKLDRKTTRPNFKAVLHVVRRNFAFIAALKSLSKQGALNAAEAMIEEAMLELYKKRPGRSHPRVSKQPINVWNLCKKKKLAAYEKSRSLK